jgi:hypothetical protein
MDSNKTPKIIRELTKNIEKPTNGEQKKGGGLRFNEGKLRYDLEHPLARRDLVKVLTYGANKYTLYNEDGSIKEKGDRNWEKGMNWTTVIASAKRHLDALERGEDYDFDPECEGCKSGFCQTHSGQLHVSLLQTNAHFLNAYYYIYPQGDDRKKWYLNIRESKLQAAKEAGVEIFVDDSYGNFVDLNNNGVTCYLRSTRQNERYNVGHLRINDLNDLPFLNY